MAELVLNGKITQVFESKGGIAKNGNQWKLQQYVLEIPNGEYEPKHCVFDVFGEDKINKFNIQKGGEYTVSIEIDAREYQGRWYNSIRAWKVVPEHTVTDATASPEQQQATAEVVDKLKAFNAEPVHDAGSDCNSPEIPF